MQSPKAFMLRFVCAGFPEFFVEGIILELEKHKPDEPKVVLFFVVR